MAAIPQETLKTLLGRGAAPGQAFVWDGARWVAGSVGGFAIVDPDEPSSPATGQLWFDTDDTC